MYNKILYISKAIIPSRSANSVHVMKMASGFAQLGIETGLLHFGEAESEDETVFKAYDVGFGFRRFPASWSTNWGLRQYRFWRHATGAIRAYQPDLIYTRDIHGAIYGTLMGYPTILELHTPTLSKLDTLLMRRLLQDSKLLGVVAISESLRGTLLEDSVFRPFRRKIVVEHDGCDFEQIRRRIGESEKTFEKKVVYTGHLYRGRGIELILDMATRLLDYEFILVGGTPSDMDRVEEDIRNRRLNNVKLTGHVTQDLLPVYWRIADVLVMPYQRTVSVENKGDTSAFMSPLKMFEYLATGRPIVSSDLPVLREVLRDHENCLLVNCEDPEQWVNGIREIECSATLRNALKKNQLETARYHSWGSRAKRLLSFANDGMHESLIEGNE